MSKKKVTFKQAVSRACENLFAVQGLIKPEHTFAMARRVEGALAFQGFKSMASVKLNDEDESAEIKAISSKDEVASLTLKWQKTDGTYIARVDTDGDGK